MNIYNVIVDVFHTKIYDNKDYNCKCWKFDNFVSNIYNKNKFTLTNIEGDEYEDECVFSEDKN